MNTISEIKISPKKVLVALLGISALLVALSVYGQYLKYFAGSYDIKGAFHEFIIDLLMHSFYTDSESNVPTWFNTIVLFIPAMLFAVISAVKKLEKDRFWW